MPREHGSGNWRHVDRLGISHKYCLTCGEEGISKKMTECPSCGSDKLLGYHEEDRPRDWGFHEWGGDEDVSP